MLAETEEYRRQWESTSKVTVHEEMVDFSQLIGGSTGNVSNRRNVVSWLPISSDSSVPPRALVVVCHGLHEHCYRHHAFAMAMAERGCAVWGMDHFGHGLSDGLKGMVYDYKSLVNDWVVFVQQYLRSKPEYSTLPLLVYCHSMGTLINFLALPRLSPPPKAALFSGCALVSGPDASSPFGMTCLYPVTQTKSAVTLARFLAATAPEGDAAPIILEGLTHDETEREIDRLDPRVYHGAIRNKTAYELLQLIVECLGSEGLAKFPMSMDISFHHGADDALTFPKGSEIAFEACPCVNKALFLQAGCKHEMLHENPETRTRVLGEMCSFFESSLSGEWKGSGKSTENPSAVVVGGN